MKGLVLSGGGVKGAFQLGALDVLIGELRTEYDFLSGVSVGGLNIAMLAQAPKGHILGGYVRLSELWEGISGNQDIWKHWFFHEAAGVWKDSFYNSDPLWQLIKANVDSEQIRASGRQCRWGVVRYGDGEYYEATERTEDLRVHIYGSATFPGFFTPKWHHGDLLIDGGARMVTPLKGAIKAGCTGIDVILTGPRTTERKELKDNWLGTKRSALTVLLRTVELMSDELFARDVEWCLKVNDDVAAGRSDKRSINLRVFEPREPLLDGALDSLQFDPTKIAMMRQKGCDAARSLLGG